MDQRMDPEILAASQESPSAITADDWLTLPPEQLRAAYAAVRTPKNPVEPAPTALEIPGDAGARDALLFGDPGKNAILYFHGGGWIIGSPQTHAAVTAALSRASDRAVLSLDYRLAPEHVAPAPIEDGRAAMDWLLSQGVERLVLAGDSAGAAVALAVERRYGTDYPIAGCVSFYGAFGLQDSVSIRLHGAQEGGLNRQSIAHMYAAACGGSADNPYDADGLARGRAPLWLLAGELDPLRDDSLCLAELAGREGRTVVLQRISGVPHAFLQFAGRAAVADRAIESASNWIKSLN